MATFEVHAGTSKSPSEVFGFLADMTNATGWDPSIIGVARTEEGPLQVGSGFSVTLGFLGAEKVLTYRITEFEAPERLVLRSESSFLVSEDTVEVKANDDGGSTVRYHASLSGKGLAVLVEPFLQAVLSYFGKGAKPGLLSFLSK